MDDYRQDLEELTGIVRTSLPGNVETLATTLVENQNDPLLLVDFLYSIAEYVDNEFFSVLGRAGAGGDKSSVLRLRSYDQSASEQVAKYKQSLQSAVSGSDTYIDPIADTANRIVDVMRRNPSALEAFENNASEAYSQLLLVVEEFIGVMHGVLSHLPDEGAPSDRGD